MPTSNPKSKRCSERGSLALFPDAGWIGMVYQFRRGFLLDYEDDAASTAEEGKGSKKKNPCRHRWPDEVRARLIKLNAVRAEEEKMAGEVAAAVPAKSKRASSSKTKIVGGESVQQTKWNL